MVLFTNEGERANCHRYLLQVVNETLGDHDGLHLVDIEEYKDQVLHQIGVSILNHDHQVDVVIVDGLAPEDLLLVVDYVLKDLILHYLQLVEAGLQLSMSGKGSVGDLLNFEQGLVGEGEEVEELLEVRASNLTVLFLSQSRSRNVLQEGVDILEGGLPVGQDEMCFIILVLLQHLVQLLVDLGEEVEEKDGFGSSRNIVITLLSFFNILHILVCCQV